MPVNCYEEDLDYHFDGVFGFRKIKSEGCSSGILVEVYSCDNGYCDRVMAFDSYWIKGFKKMAKKMGL